MSACRPRCPHLTNCPFFGELSPDPLPVVRITCSISLLPPADQKCQGGRDSAIIFSVVSPVTWPIAGTCKPPAAQMHASTCRMHTQDPGWRLKELRENWAGPGTRRVHPLTQSPTRSSWGAAGEQGSHRQCRRGQGLLPRPPAGCPSALGPDGGLGRAHWPGEFMWSKGEETNSSQLDGELTGGARQSHFPEGFALKAHRSEETQTVTDCPYTPVGARQ